jgi:biopolymer transport protein ExbD
MKFPRNSKILRSQFDVAPFAAVFFVIVIFMLLGALLPVPGLRTNLLPPSANDLPGVNAATIAMAVDNAGRLYFENQIISERVLINNLKVAVGIAPSPLTLVIHADKAVTYEQLAHLTLLARDVGITNALLATLPRVAEANPKP